MGLNSDSQGKEGLQTLQALELGRGQHRGPGGQGFPLTTSL